MGRAWHDPGVEQVPGAWGGVGGAGTAQCNPASAGLGSLLPTDGVSK